MSLPPRLHNRHPRSAHLRQPAEFDRCFKDGRRSGSLCFGYVFRRHDQTDIDAGIRRSRLGLAISRRVDKRAVERNRLRRLVREWFRHNEHRFPAGDLVVSGRPAARGRDAARILAELDRLPERLGLPLVDGVGKMPGSPTTSHPSRQPDSTPSANPQ